MTTTDFVPFTEKQGKFLKKLGEERTGNDKARRIMASARMEWHAQTLDKRKASQYIEILKDIPADPKAPIPDGLHVVVDSELFDSDGEPVTTVYKVQTSQNNRQYAKELQGTRYVYAPGAIHKLSAATVMSIEQAEAYGKMFGVCASCGRVLTNPVSIERGIGPICASKF